MNIHIKTKHIPLVSTTLQWPITSLKVHKGTITVSSHYPSYDVYESSTMCKRKYLRLIRKGTK